MTGRIAAGNLSARIALQLIAAAEAKIAGDREEPARNALGIGDRVPHVFHRRVIGPARADHPGRTAIVLSPRDLPRHRSDQARNVLCHRTLPDTPRPPDASFCLYKSILI